MSQLDGATHDGGSNTLPEENKSVSVLRKCGFKFSDEVADPEDRPIWRWQLLKSIPDK
jgi:hypothetical protein